MKATISVVRQTEYVAEFEGDTLEEIIIQAIFEGRGPGASIISESATVVQTDEIISSYPPIKVGGKVGVIQEVLPLMPSDQRE